VAERRCQAVDEANASLLSASEKRLIKTFFPPCGVRKLALETSTFGFVAAGSSFSAADTASKGLQGEFAFVVAETMELE
jgi:hypothetical protein